MDTEPAAGEATGKASAAQSGGKADKRALSRASRVSSRSANKTVQSTASKQKGRDKRSNRVREARIERMMSKAELARRAGLSVLTIDRVEKGLESRMDTKRKILEALELSLADRVRVFGEEE